MLSFFPDALDEIFNLIESVSEGFPTYFSRLTRSKEPQLGGTVNHGATKLVVICVRDKD